MPVPLEDSREARKEKITSSIIGNAVSVPGASDGLRQKEGQYYKMP